jgi:hypothetical protein
MIVRIVEWGGERRRVARLQVRPGHPTSRWISWSPSMT